MISQCPGASGHSAAFCHLYDLQGLTLRLSWRCCWTDKNRAQTPSSSSLVQPPEIAAIAGDRAGETTRSAAASKTQLVWYTQKIVVWYACDQFRPQT